MNILIRSNHLIFWILGASILGIYSYPFLAAWNNAGFTVLPPSLAPDLYFYLNLINLQTIEPGVVLNPWYGIHVPTSDIPHLRFGLALKIFLVWQKLIGSNWSLAVFLWNVIWVALIILSALWLFRTIVPEGPLSVLAISLAILLLADLTTYELAFKGWSSLPSLHEFEHRKLFLPYVRTFYPQVSIPLIFIYVTLQIRACMFQKLISWLLMVLTLLLTFAAFPYAALLMVSITGITLLILLILRKLFVHWRNLIIFCLLSAAGAAGYLLINGPPFRGWYIGEQTIVSWNLFRMANPFDAMVVFWIFIFTIGIVLLRDKGRVEVKWTLVALGMATNVLLIADLVLSPVLMLSSHIGYLTHTTWALLFAYLLARIYIVTVSKFPIIRWLIVGGIAVLTCHGAFIAKGTYNRVLPIYKAQVELIQLLNLVDLNERDLIIAPARTVDSEAMWIPLIAKSHILFAPIGAESVLPEASRNHIRRYRQALYLFMIGKDSAWLERIFCDKEKEFLPLGKILSDREKNTLPTFLWSYDGMLLAGPERNATLLKMRNELIPLLLQIENKDWNTAELFRKYERILVIEDKNDPMFSRDRILSYLIIVKEEEKGSYNFRWCKPS